ncbi:hypothetical protein Gotri_014713, partial [Gossypium trilobum]|nr:hypothetical protein [Gossypium trilobum]
LASCKDTLCFRVLSAKYFPNGDVFRPKRVDKPSFTWKSIARAASILREVNETKVCELINKTSDGWKEKRVIEIYGAFMGDQIYKIPILHNGPDNYRIWFHSSLGSYLTKSAYSWMTLKHVGFGPHRCFWRLFWKLHNLPKIKIFYWRMGHDILPTYEKISKIWREFNIMCPGCESKVETLIHVLKDCPRARAVLVHEGIDNALVEGSYERCMDWIEDAAHLLDKKALSDFVTVLWNIWNNRNNKVFRET